jgi:hypothetical protein
VYKKCRPSGKGLPPRGMLSRDKALKHVIKHHGLLVDGLKVSQKQCPSNLKEKWFSHVNTLYQIKEGPLVLGTLTEPFPAPYPSPKPAILCPYPGCFAPRLLGDRTKKSFQRPIYRHWKKIHNSDQEDQAAFESLRKDSTATKPLFVWGQIVLAASDGFGSDHYALWPILVGWQPPSASAPGPAIEPLPSRKPSNMRRILASRSRGAVASLESAIVRHLNVATVLDSLYKLCSVEEIHALVLMPKVSRRDNFSQRNLFELRLAKVLAYMLEYMSSAVDWLLDNVHQAIADVFVIGCVLHLNELTGLAS